MLLRSQACIDIEMWSFIMHLWTKHLLQQQKASNPISAIYQLDRKSNSRNTLYSFFLQMWLQNQSVISSKRSSASLSKLDINPSILWKGMNLSNVSSFIRISSIYLAIFKYTMLISFHPPKPPNMWKYTSICLSLWWNSRLCTNWIALWLLLQRLVGWFCIYQ